MTDETSPTDSDSPDDQQQRPLRADRTVPPQAIEPGQPEEFGLVQVWWGDGKGKTTAAMGMGFRAAGHGYRVHMLQFMKGGTTSVEDVRGEYNAIDAFPGFSYENSGHYGWHGGLDGSADDEHAARAQGGLQRAMDLVEAARGADGPLPLDGPPDDGVHMLVLDEILYAVEQGLLDSQDVVDLVEAKPSDLELVLTGGHEKPGYVYDHADLVSRVSKEKHPIDAGQSARKGTEY
jgi:cob(I)alamin adenosyltransferase